MPLLEKYDLSFATEDNFTPGKDRFTSLQNVTNESRTALIIITPDLLQEKWKLYQLNQVICMQLEQTSKSFSCYVVSQNTWENCQKISNYFCALGQQ